MKGKTSTYKYTLGIGEGGQQKIAERSGIRRQMNAVKAARAAAETVSSKLGNRCWWDVYGRSEIHGKPTTDWAHLHRGWSDPVDRP